MQTSTALFIANSKLWTSAHCFRTCPDDGRGRYVLLFITIEIITSWRSVSSFQSYPKGLKRNLECNPCATGDEFHTQFFCILIMWKSSVVPKTVVLHFRLLYWEYLHAVLVSVIQREQRPVSRLQISVTRMKTCIASCGIWAVAILKYLLCLSAGFSWLFNVRTRSCSRFSFDWQLAPAGLHSDLVTVDADWRRLNLLTYSRRTSLKTQTQIWNWLKQRPHRT